MPPTRKRLSTSSGLKWQNFNPKAQTSIGRRPLDQPSTFKQLMAMLCMHACKKILLYRTEFKAGIYIFSCILISGFSDTLPIPRSYFSNKGNIFNQYFVKLGWGWTLSILAPFIFYTSLINCSGNRAKIRWNMLRLAIGTVIWYICTTLFESIESSTGICSVAKDKLYTKALCVKSGSKWYGFDISGHTFLLMYCGLMILEEAKGLKAFEKMVDLIKKKEYEENSPLSSLTDEEYEQLTINSEKYSTLIYGNFIIMSFICILWDVMMVATFLYFHNMIQKVIAAFFAIAMWFLTYRLIYPNVEALSLIEQPYVVKENNI